MESIIQSALMDGRQSWYVIGIVFATGLLTSLTPCIYPMIPITVSVIGKQAKSSHKRNSEHPQHRHYQTVILSLIYVLGLALVYAGLGVLAASTGQLFGVVASHPITLLFVAGFCLVMALWILEWVTLPKPRFLVKLSEHQTSTNHGWLNVFIAGCLSGLVMAPCTSPVLGMLLMYVASEGQLAWAALLMFTFALGMSALLVLAGSVSGFVAVLPRSGHWLSVVKWLMALPMLGVAVYFSLQALPLSFSF
ncbi:cytochrome c biogenesis protein CcdA [Psychrobium sp. 1_MG-2023]|uniref:cytochrome c biogenesis protein CcdA n=1 Tax=Psychrobium sp. 1_MG-2023 TaxID=3062624 RepID=UPI000C32E9AA|nr:cytochrome c biogenesis protein CcdA [Psychrobium sp. 1_MG-2023]MDP2562663.1 cytochrome c biogenesis protein CcdA [Psychrobium sp. 1_MG-2023]PKF53808.1 cytochrome C biogenesis protein [Alteromonadales bacterium alter-6D02]